MKYEEIKKVIEKRLKLIPKDIGDRVKILDCSYNQDLETGKSYSGLDEIANDIMIIIEKNCKNIRPISEGPVQANRDIVVYSPKYKRKIATCMKYVKLVNNFNSILQH